MIAPTSKRLVDFLDDDLGDLANLSFGYAGFLVSLFGDRRWIVGDLRWFFRSFHC